MNSRLASLALAAVIGLASMGALAQTTTGATAPSAPNVNAAPTQTGSTTAGTTKLKSHHVKHMKPTSSSTGAAASGSTAAQPAQ